MADYISAMNANVELVCAAVKKTVELMVNQAN